MTIEPNSSVLAESGAAQKRSLWVTLGALLVLVLSISFSPPDYRYDETFHQDLAERMQDVGLIGALNSPDNQSAAGPLYPVVHLAFSPLTSLKAPWIRWVNVLCLLVTMGFVAASVPLATRQGALLVGLSLLAIPFLYPAAGMALTELPALAAFSIFVWAILVILRDDRPSANPKSLCMALVAGMALGIAILGRQTYLIVLPAFLPLYFLTPRKALLWSIALGLSAALTVWLFVTWKGLVPPSQQHVGGGIRWENGILSLGYVAVATLFLNPVWLKPENLKTWAVVLGSGCVVAVLTRDYQHPPAHTLLVRLFGEAGGLAVGFGIGAVMTAAALGILWKLCVLLLDLRHNPEGLFLICLLLALILAPMKVSHLFSSRYVVGLVGVLVLVMPSAVNTRWFPWQMILGCSVGLAVLQTYY
jgi:hypothetical protein